MAADFNAGSIEGTLGLDSTPFRTGLTKAKADAKAFEDAKITPSLELDAKAFDAERTKATEQIRELGAKTARPSVDPRGILSSLAQIELVQKAMDGLSKHKAMNFGAGAFAGAEGLAGSAAKFLLMPAAILSIVAALGPATAAVVAFGGAAAVAFGGAAIALGFFAKLVASDFKTIQDATKKGLTLKGPAGEAQKALKSLGSAWDEFKKKTSGPVFGFLANAFNLASKVLPKFEPLMRTVARGMDGVLKVLGKFTQGPLFANFLKSLQGFMRGFLQGLGPGLVSFLRMFMDLFIGLQPLISMLGKGLLDAFDAADRFGKSLQHGGISGFVQTMKDDLPLLGRLVSSLFGAFNGLGKSLAPLAGPALRFLTDTLQAIGDLDLSPLSSGLGKVLDALDPLLGPLSELVNTLLAPLGDLLGDIADTAITPFATGLSSALAPALHSLSDILDTIEPVLAQFVASIANLANPTGIAFITTMLDSFSQIIKPLAKPVGDLVVALESMVDDALRVLTAILPAVTPMLVGLSKALGWIVDVLAGILSHEAVVDVILGLVAAFKALQIIVGIASAIRGVVAAFAAFQTIAATEGIIAGIAAVAPGAAAGIDMIGTAIDVAFGPVGIIVGVVAAGAAFLGLSHFIGGVGQAARDNMQSVSALAATMDKVTGAYTRLTREEATKELIGKDAFKNATKLGISFDTVSAAALGNAKAIAAVTAVTKPAMDAISNLRQVGQDQWENMKTGQKVGYDEYVMLGKRADAAKALADAVGAVSSAAAAGRKQTLLAAIANGDYTKSLAHIPSTKILKIGTEGAKAAMADILALATQGAGLTKNQIRILVGLVPGSEAAAKAAIERIAAAADRAAHSREILFTARVTGTTNALLAEQASSDPQSPSPKKGGRRAHAQGTITSGPETALIGDNPGGREAVIPLDKYDLPRKGDAEAQARVTAQANSQMIDLLVALVHATTKNSPEALAGALGDILAAHAGAQTRAMVQAARAA